MNVVPDRLIRHGDKYHVEKRYGGTTFVNVPALARWFVKDHAMPHSRLFTLLKIQCYMHKDEYSEQGFNEAGGTRVSVPFEEHKRSCMATVGTRKN